MIYTRFNFRLAAFFLGTALAAMVSAPAAWAGVVFSTSPGALSSNGIAVNASANFTAGNGFVSITLQNSQQNPIDVSQLISGVTFSITGATGTGALSSTNSGLITTIDTNGTYASGVSDPLTRWKANYLVGSDVRLTTISGGQPNRLIIGPDNLGGFNGAGVFSNANASIKGNKSNDGHNPTVLGSATFNVSIAGVTTASRISDVFIEFGSDGFQVSAIPEPTSMALCGIGMALGIGGIGLRSRRSRN